MVRRDIDERWIRVYAGVAREVLICPRATRSSIWNVSLEEFQTGVMGITPLFLGRPLRI